MLYRVRQCEMCQAGEDGVTCLRDMDGNKGQCPVADNAPTLDPFNALAVEVFQQARPSANQVAADDKTYLYLRPESIEAIMRMQQIPLDDRAEMFRRVLLLQDMANQLRPNRPKKRAAKSRPMRRF